MILVVVAVSVMFAPSADGGFAVPVSSASVSPFAGCAAAVPELQPGQLVPVDDAQLAWDKGAASLTRLPRA
jgi:hypothetical protein